MIYPVQAKPSNLNELLAELVEIRPEQLAFTYLRDGEKEEASWTYGKLASISRAIAAYLQSLNLCGERALLVYPPGLDFIGAFWGCLQSKVIAVPVYPPRSNRNALRLASIVEDSDATVILTNSATLRRLRAIFETDPKFAPLRHIATDELSEELSADWRMPNLDHRCVAFLQYTSGSTQEPKGVVLRHANLLHNEAAIKRSFRQDENSMIVSWLPLYHDMGLIGGVLQPLYLGARCVLMSPNSFLQRPYRWLDAITRYRATTSGGPNFAYEQCTRKISEEEEASLDLSSWEVAFNGAEPVRAATLENFSRRFAKVGFNSRSFLPCYGLAEATLLVSGHSSGTQPNVLKLDAEALSHNLVKPNETASGRSVVSCGRISQDSKAVIVNPESLNPTLPAEIGEIWIAGPSVAEGYWKRPTESEDVFQARTAAGHGPFLRTGDLGFVSNDELFIVGRRKEVIVIRGRNHYPQDLEATTEKAHPALRGRIGAAFSVDLEGEERLVLVHEINPRLQAEADSVIGAVCQAIAKEHDLQLFVVALTPPGEIPRTTSGKIQRSLCRKAFLASDLKILNEWRATFTLSDSNAKGDDELQIEDWQTWLILQLAQRLHIPPEMVEADQPPFRYGLDSLAAVELAHEIEKKTGTVFPSADLISGFSIAELAAALRWQKELAATGAALAPMPQQHRAVRFPLSYGQRALFFLYQLDPQNSAYHIYQAVRIASVLDEQALGRAFRLLVRRHPVLRTVFRLENGSPVQELLSVDDGPIVEEHPYSETQDQLMERMARAARAPFDLESAPPVRCILFRTAEPENYLLFAIHHIISDFWSLALLIQELAALYEAEAGNRVASLPPPELEYGDYVRWQADMLSGAEGERHWAYWREELAGELPTLDLPTDFPRPAVQTFRGAAHQFRLDAGLRNRLRSLAAQNGATFFSVLLSAWAVLLHRYSGQSEVPIGSPAAGRTHAAFRSVAGYFVNPIVIRANFDGDPRFEILLAQVREKVLGALAHQDFPFPLLVEKLQPQRDPGRSPLFQALFALQGEIAGASLALFALGESGAVFETQALRLESVSLGEEASQFDIDLQACEAQGELVLRLQYNADLFKPQTIERMASNLSTLLESLDSSRRVSELPLLSREERLTLESWNLTEARFPKVSSLHEMIEAQVERTPNNPAIWYEGRFLSYADLNCRANQLAHHLQSLGVGPESLVGVCMERSFALVTALLGVLKAGGAYVPFDPSFPRERLSYLVQDSGVPILLVQDAFSASFDSQRLIVSLDAECRTLHNQSTANPRTSVSPDNLAYLIYTSGSTGNPKGAMNSHRGVCNLLQSAQAKYELDAKDRVLQNTTFAFDASIWELFWPLTAGASLVLARPGGHRDSAYLRDLINESQITTVQIVPSMLSAFLDEPGVESCVSLRLVLAGAEVLPVAVVRRFFSRLNAKLYNTYGPTEASVDATAFTCSPNDLRSSIPIGAPNANIQTYILNSQFERCPIGVAGELHIGGVGVGRGYHRRAALTAERFLPNPFSNQSGARMYKTGDLVRYLPDNNIEFLGRNDHQVKIRGFRIELGEIEAALGACPGVREAVVVATETSSEGKRLAAYVVPEDADLLSPHAGGPVPVLKSHLAYGAGLPAAGMRAFLQGKLPSYMIPHYFVLLQKLPRTPSGKLDRRALPAPTPEADLEQEQSRRPRNAEEEILCGIFAEVLKLEQVGVESGFFELGGHSLLATQVMSRTRTVFGVDLPLQVLFEGPTVEALAAKVEEALRQGEKTTAPPLEPIAREGPLPLSFAQQRLWFLEQLDPGSAAYNSPGVVRLAGRLDVSAVQRTLDEIVRRHEILRTTFPAQDGEPVQHIAPAGTVDVRFLDFSETDDREHKALELAREEARRPFDLSRGPLLRTRLVQLEPELHLLLFTLHHSVCDAWSVTILAREFTCIYTAFLRGGDSPLPELPIQYVDFACWQRQWLSGDVLEEYLSYWRQKLTALPPLELRIGKGRSDIRAGQGQNASFDLSPVITDALKEISRKQGATLFMTMLGAFEILMHRYSGQTDFAVGMPVAGRDRVEIENLIGFFVNMLPLRVDLNGNPSFVELLERVRATTLEAHSHQALPLEKLIEELKPARVHGRPQIFQVTFALQNDRTDLDLLPGGESTLIEMDEDTVRFGLVLWILPTGAGYRSYWRYNSGVFKAHEIEQLNRSYCEILEGIARDSAARVSELAGPTHAKEVTQPISDRTKAESHAGRIGFGTRKRNAVVLS